MLLGMGEKNPLLNTQHQTNIKHTLTTKDLLWFVSSSTLSKQKVFKLLYFPHTEGKTKPKPNKQKKKSNFL